MFIFSMTQVHSSRTLTLMCTKKCENGVQISQLRALPPKSIQQLLTAFYVGPTPKQEPPNTLSEWKRGTPRYAIHKELLHGPNVLPSMQTNWDTDCCCLSGQEGWRAWLGVLWLPAPALVPSVWSYMRVPSVFSS